MQVADLFHRFDPERLYFRQAIRTALVATIAILINEIFGFQADLFGVWSAIFIIQVNSGLTIKRQLITIGVTGGVSALAVAIATLLQDRIVLVSIFVASAAFATPIFGSKGFHRWNFAFRVTLLSLLAAQIPAPDPQYAIDRMVQVAMGTLLAALICLVVWPHRPRPLFRSSLRATLLSAASFYDSIVTLVPDDSRERAINRFQLQRDRSLRLLHRNGQIWDAWSSRRPPSHLYARLEDELDQIFEILFSLSLLRYKWGSPERMQALVPTLQQFGEAVHQLVDRTPGHRADVSTVEEQMRASIAQIDRSGGAPREVAFLLYLLGGLSDHCIAIAGLIDEIAREYE